MPQQKPSTLKYAFGMTMPGRNLNPTDYRYGFQAQEEDDEFWGGAVTYKYRVEDPRLGRFFSVDPLAEKYAYNSPYAFSENRLIDGIELDGLEYLNSWESLIYITGGEVRIKVSNLSDINRGLVQGYINNPDNWEGGFGGSLSPVAQVSWISEPKVEPGEFIIGPTLMEFNFGNSSGATDVPLLIETPIAQSTGQPDRRYKIAARINSAGGIRTYSAPKARGLLSLEIVVTGVQVAGWLTGWLDEATIEYQRDKQLAFAVADVQLAIDMGMIPDDLLNVTDLSEIANVVLFGDESVTGVNRFIGMQIVKTISQNEKNTTEYIETDVESGYNIFLPDETTIQLPGEEKYQTEQY